MNAISRPPEATVVRLECGCEMWEHGDVLCVEPCRLECKTVRAFYAAAKHHGCTTWAFHPGDTN